MALDRLHLRKRRRQSKETKFNMIWRDAFRSAYDKVFASKDSKYFIKLVNTQ